MSNDLVVIHQIHFLPWLPFVAKIAKSSTFVILDDIQYQPRYFVNRSKIFNKSSGRLEWITIPTNGTRNSITKNVKIYRDKTYGKMLNKIYHEYKNDKYYYLWEHYLSIIENEKIESLIDLNLLLLKHFFEQLEIEFPKVYFSSQLLMEEEIQGRTDRFIKICSRVNQNHILTGFGKGIIVHDIDSLKKNNIKLTYGSNEDFSPWLDFAGRSFIHDLFKGGISETRKNVLELANKYSKQI